jgi:hypothetical protein
MRPSGVLLVPGQLEVLGQRLLGYAAPQLQGWQQQGKVGMVQWGTNVYIIQRVHQSVVYRCAYE